MKSHVMTTTFMSLLAFQGAATAASPDELSKRIEYLEKRVAIQEQAFNEKNTAQVEVGGLIEFEAARSEEVTDMAIATVEIGLSGRVNEHVSGEITLLYEGETTDVDVAAINITSPGSNWSYNVGQIYVPFGQFESNMVSDPLTLEIGETRESAIQANYESGEFSAALYVFKGTNLEDSGAADKVDNYGISINYANEEGVMFGASYINDIGDSDGLQDGLASNNIVAHVPGVGAHLMVEMGAFTLIGEYVAATKAFDVAELAYGAAGAQPEATNLEVAYAFELGGKGATLAAGVQTTSEAEALDLPEQRTMLALSSEIMENTTLAFEYARDEAYDKTKTSTATMQLAVEF